MPDSLPEDLAQRVGENTTRLVPEEGQTGDFLRVTGQMPFSYVFQQGPDEDVPRYPGTPDGNLTAPIDSLVRNTVDHELWINVDGATAWSQIGGTATLITDSFYEFVDDTTTTGNAYNAGDVANTWTTSGLSGFNNGSDVTLSSGVVTIVNTGVYSIAATWDIKADTAADSYSFARGRFTLDRTNEPGSPVHDQVFLDDLKTPAVNPSDNKHMANFSVSITAFMYAGDQIVTEGRFEHSSDPGSTWSFVTASMYVERLA